jgi:hypothetical protein
MLVRHGSMVNASRSLLPRPSTLSTISVRTAAREPEHDPGEIHCLCQEEEFGSCCKHPHGDRMNDVCAFSSVRTSCRFLMCRLMYVNDVLDFLLLVISNCSSMHFLKLPVHLYWTSAVLDISVVHYVSPCICASLLKMLCHHRCS